MGAQSPLSPEDAERLHAKIVAAERLTSAELRVILTRSSWLGIKQRARALFTKHGLDKTAQRNAVMILVDTRSRELLIYGDEGVDSRVDPGFWDDVRDAMIEEFRAGHLADGLSAGIRMVGEKLSVLFPASGADTDEIANDIIFE